jgi:hypothetical protein
MTDVAAFMMTIGVFPSADTGAEASAAGVSANPARMSTLSRVTSSCASRLLTSPEVPGASSFRISWTLRPANTSPFRAR